MSPVASEIDEYHYNALTVHAGDDEVRRVGIESLTTSTPYFDRSSVFGLSGSSKGRLTSIPIIQVDRVLAIILDDRCPICDPIVATQPLVLGALYSNVSELGVRPSDYCFGEDRFSHRCTTL